MRRYVLTGAPGAGKTSVLHALRDLGFTVVPEAATVPTAARRISYAESLEFERVHEEVYREHGFVMVEVGPAGVAKRAAAIAEAIASQCI